MGRAWAPAGFALQNYDKKYNYTNVNVLNLSTHGEWWSRRDGLVTSPPGLLYSGPGGAIGEWVVVCVFFDLESGYESKLIT